MDVRSPSMPDDHETAGRIRKAREGATAQPDSSPDTR